MKISNRLYDVSKWIILVFLPSLSVLVGSLSKIYSWTDGSALMATINLLTVFLGSLLQLSSQKYNNSSHDLSGGIENDTNGSK